MLTLKTLLHDLRLKLRVYWLLARRDLKQVVTVCHKCRSLGAYPCSICACIPLCTKCQREESIKLDKRLHGET